MSVTAMAGGSGAAARRARARSRLPGWPAAAGIVAGMVADALLGDPRRGHPVALFGRAAQAAGERAYADSRLRGAGYAAGCVLGAAAPALLAEHLTRGRPWLRFAATAAAVWTVTGARSLTREAQRIAAALQAGDLTAARVALPSLCGRDPGSLDESGLVRAVVESVAENTSDAVVAPLVFGVLAGLPGLTGYRAATTWHAMRRYGGRHPSPNAGRCEAAFAGALGVRLGGTSSYAGAFERRPVLGRGRAPELGDIRRAVRLCRAVTITATAAAAATAVAAAAADAAIGVRTS